MLQVCKTLNLYKGNIIPLAHYSEATERIPMDRPPPKSPSSSYASSSSVLSYFPSSLSDILFNLMLVVIIFAGCKRFRLDGAGGWEE
jgi:hypothetical protein